MSRRNQESTPSTFGSAAARATSTPDSYWRSFPVLERTLGQEEPALLKQIETTCRQLDEIQRTGSPAEKARAADAMQGYARALELYRELVERREYAMEQASNSGKVGRDK